MKLETVLYDKVKSLILKEAEKTIFFCEIEDSSYEVFFYSFINGRGYQCFELSEQDVFDENVLDKIFSEIVDIIRNSDVYYAEKRNVATIIVNQSGVKLDLQRFNIDERLYRIKKEWEKEYLF